MINVLIVDDHPTIRIGTKAILECEEDMKVSILTDIEEILDAVKAEKYEIFLVDLYMPEVNGIGLTKMILQLNSDAKVLIYSGFDLISHYNILIAAGAVGFISKLATPEQLTNAIRCAMREEAVIPLQLLKQLRRTNVALATEDGLQNLGDITLSNREQDILNCIGRGLTNKKISDELFLSQRAIEYNLTKIFNKLKVSSRAEALQVANKFGLISKQFVYHE